MVFQADLERDLFYLNEISKNKIIKKTIKNILNFNDKVVNKIYIKIFWSKRKVLKLWLLENLIKKFFSEVIQYLIN